MLAALEKALCPHTNCVCRAVVPMSRDHCSWLLGQLGIGCGSNQNPQCLYSQNEDNVNHVFPFVFSPEKKRNNSIHFILSIFLLFHVLFFVISCYVFC